MGNKNLYMTLMVFALMFVSCLGMDAQVVAGGAQWDCLVYNMGSISKLDGKYTLIYRVKNISDKDMTIVKADATCHCTTVKWTREPIKPGEYGEVVATYDSSEDHLMFSKTVNVYLSTSSKPVLLKYHGTVVDGNLFEGYPMDKIAGPLGYYTRDIQLGNLKRDTAKMKSICIRNNTKAPVTLSFADIPEGLKIVACPSVLPAGGEGYIQVAVNPCGLESGNREFMPVVLAGGKEVKDADGLALRLRISFSVED